MLIFLKSPFRHGVEAGAMLGLVLLPAFVVPKFQMMLHADQHHVALQIAEPGEAFRHQDAAVAVHIHGFCLGEKQPAKTRASASVAGD